MVNQDDATPSRAPAGVVTDDVLREAARDWAARNGMHSDERGLVAAFIERALAPTPSRGPGVSKAMVAEWQERHGLMMSATDARAAFEDAATAHLSGREA